MVSFRDDDAVGIRVEPDALILHGHQDARQCLREDNRSRHREINVGSSRHPTSNVATAKSRSIIDSSGTETSVQRRYQDVSSLVGVGS